MNDRIQPVILEAADLQDLRRAKSLLEQPSLAARVTSALGTPIEKGFELLPARWSDTIHAAVEKSLNRALNVAVRSLPRRRSRFSSDRMHQAAVVATGATGGALGLPGLLVELPLSTTLMLRAVADIARREGEDLETIEAELACLEVFAFGGPGPGDDAAETGYFAVRSALAKAVSEAAAHIARRGLTEAGAPALVRLMSSIGARFGVVVSEKVAAMAVPAIGAAGGALINSLFMSHFQDMAKGHFTVRRLERRYGADVVRRAYEEIEI